MADVVVDARRLRSMLRHRHQTVDDLCAAVGEHARTHAIETSRIDFETLQDIARYLKRPWPYLLIDGEERWGSDKYAHRGADFGERDASVELMEA